LQQSGKYTPALALLPMPLPSGDTSHEIERRAEHAHAPAQPDAPIQPLAEKTGFFPLAEKTVFFRSIVV
jgi:hypothetical protein